MGRRKKEDKLNLLKDKELKALIDISRFINSAIEYEQLLICIMQITKDVMNVEATSLILLDEKTDTLTFHTVTGPRSDELGKISLNKNEGIAGWVLNHGMTVIVNDVEKDKRFSKRTDKTTGFKTKSILAVPLFVEKQINGVIELINKKSRSGFNEQDVSFCEAIAGLAAESIEKTRLYSAKLKAEHLAGIGEAVAGLSHCIKNILNSLKWGSHVVDGGLKENKLELLAQGWQVVQKNIGLMTDLTLDMLTLSKERKPEYKMVNLNSIIDEVMQLVEEKAVSLDVEIQKDLDCNVGDVYVDPTGIYRCLLNLVTNAIDACSEGREKKICIKSFPVKDEKRIQIDISDTGCGIAEDVINHLFKTAFFSTKGSKGTGLGLPVTYKIIKEHKGDIFVQSEINKGAVFSINLPIESFQGI